MKSGLNFFPCCRPSEKPAERFYVEALKLSEDAERLGYASIKVVEHHGSPYGGYSPSALIFLASIAQRTERVRLVTGAVIPAFNHPLRLAAELAMVDCMSGGRLDAGFARAFLPHEFEAFSVGMEESRARFEEGIAAVRRLWTEDEVTFDGRFHSFEEFSLLPKPLQRPHPPIKVAAVSTPQSFQWAGEQGYGLMVVPYLSDFDDLAENLRLYRTTFRGSAGAEPPPVSVVMHMLCASTDAQAQDDGAPHMDQYVAVAKQATAAWGRQSSSQYPGYEKVYNTLEALTYDRVLAEKRALIGSPEAVARQLIELEARFGSITIELNTMFGDMDFATAERSVRLYGREALAGLADRDATLVA